MDDVKVLKMLEQDVLTEDCEKARVKPWLSLLGERLSLAHLEQKAFLKNAHIVCLCCAFSERLFVQPALKAKRSLF